MLRAFKHLVILLLFSSFCIPPKITVYLIGDSTIADKPSKVWPETGWGMPFRIFFDSTVVVDNRAKNGRSTRSFLAENLWQPVASSLQPGDYVLIQFGHNDEAKEKVERYTTPEAYKANLVKFITETREKQAIPVLITPVTRRRFKDGKIQETHTEYSKLVAEVAREQKTAFIDLDTKSRAVLQQFGEENSKWLFLQLAPGEHPNYPEGKNDNTHFSELGARLMAQIVLQEIQAQNLDLAQHIVKPIIKK